MFKTPPVRTIDRFSPPASPVILSPLHMKDRSMSLSEHKINEYDLSIDDIDSPECEMFPSQFSAGFEATSGSSVVDFDNFILSGLPSSKRFNAEELLSQIHECLLVQYSYQLNRNVIGEGSFANVHTCKVVGAGELTATFTVKIPKSKRMVKQIYKELLNYKVISDYLFDSGLNPIESPFMNCYGLAFTTNFINYNKRDVLPCLISSCLDSDLRLLSYSMLKNRESLTDLAIGSTLWWSLAKDLIDGLTIMKECKLVHSDFKSSNILYDSNTQSFKICDLTSAISEEDLINTTFENFEVSLQYCAPEMLLQQSSPNYSTDLYAVGLILLSAAIGSEPYHEILKSRNNSLIFLNECIKKNKVLDVLGVEQHNILQANEKEHKLIRSILVDRLGLEDLRALF
ncbi:hypothetical protein WICPIJ_001284 [Wickerhamomyces pijperi]|uniref:mitogen-activated protein kinase kinase n=1 Tax=Wickerhamomyces pijperi TaxID=599730 RepID=A0A9P8QBX9_WICPI|nr:hypothetical protein WICPIJ_001284 [Wickerhamomyces pijperi]